MVIKYVAISNGDYINLNNNISCYKCCIYITLLIFKFLTIGLFNINIIAVASFSIYFI